MRTQLRPHLLLGEASYDIRTGSITRGDVFQGNGDKNKSPRGSSISTRGMGEEENQEAPFQRN